MHRDDGPTVTARDHHVRTPLTKCDTAEPTARQRSKQPANQNQPFPARRGSASLGDPFGNHRDGAAGQCCRCRPEREF